MLDRIVIVIPTYKEHKNVKKLMDNIHYHLNTYMRNYSWLIVDDTPDDSIKEMIEHSAIHYRKGNGNYGTSLIVGMMHSGFNGDYNKLIIMDIDHPFDKIPEMVDMLDKYDMVIGNDLNGNKERNVTKNILSFFFDIDVPHPTCGFMGFTSEVIGYKTMTNKTISFFLALSKKDIVHVELLYMGIKKKLNIGILDFDTTNTNIKHNYSMFRYVIWLKDVAKMFLYDRFFGWYQ